jgi:hypothetical protein
MTAAGHTVLDWLVLMGWRVEVQEEDGRLHGIATRHLDGKALRVDALSDVADSLAWNLLEAATIELERHSERPRQVAACA